VRDLSVVIGMGYGNAWRCLHPWNSLCVANVIKGNGIFKFVGICLYVSLCCLNNMLEVLHSLRVPGSARNSLDGFDAVGQCVYHFVGVCNGGIGDAFVLKLDCVG
jgi:hypothetical protein